ncbi:hypothetical protein MRX96_018506 [Rhipicephalus microplus]
MPYVQSGPTVKGISIAEVHPGQTPATHNCRWRTLGGVTVGAPPRAYGVGREAREGILTVTLASLLVRRTHGRHSGSVDGEKKSGEDEEKERRAPWCHQYRHLRPSVVVVCFFFRMPRIPAVSAAGEAVSPIADARTRGPAAFPHHCVFPKESPTSAAW